MFSGQPALYVDLRGEGPVNRALIGDVEQSLSLLVVEFPLKLDFPLDPVQHSDFRRAGLAIFGMDFGMPQADRDRLE